MNDKISYIENLRGLYCTHIIKGMATCEFCIDVLLNICPTEDLLFRCFPPRKGALAIAWLEFSNYGPLKYSTEL